jgi:DNA-binding MarR family transcriptional regulator
MKRTGIDQCNCMALRRAARRISQAYDEALAASGLRATQFAILAMLRESGGLSVNALAGRMDLDRTTMGKNLRPLERDRLIAVRVSEQDRRSRSIALTPAGEAALAKAFPLWVEAQARFEAENGRRPSRALRETLAELRFEARP